jgi:hypothetical protein
MSRGAIRRRLMILSLALVSVVLVDLVVGGDDWVLQLILGVAVLMVLISGRDWLKARRLKARRLRARRSR